MRNTADCVWPIGAEMAKARSGRPMREWSGSSISEDVPSIGSCLHQRTRQLGSARPSGFVLPVSDGNRVVGLGKELAAFSPDLGSFAPLVVLETDLPENRINDGTVGPDGAVWF